MPRYLTIADVAEVLNVSVHQARTLVSTGELRAFKVGGQGKAGVWRVDEADVTAYVERMYAQTRAWIEADASQTAERQQG